MMENESDRTGMTKGVRQVLDYLAHIGLWPDLHPWIALLRKVLGQSGKARALVVYTFGQIARLRKENVKPAENTKYTTFLQKLLDMQDSEKATMVNIQDAAGSNLGAGSDTTAITLSSSLYYLYKHPEKLAKLRHELDTMAAEGRISDPITFKEAQSMPYLQAVIKEGFRMHPAVGTILPRVVPKGGARLGGFNFPEGASQPTFINLLPSPVLYPRCSLFILSSLPYRRWKRIIRADNGRTDSCRGKLLGAPL